MTDTASYQLEKAVSANVMRFSNFNHFSFSLCCVIPLEPGLKRCEATVSFVGVMGVGFLFVLMISTVLLTYKAVIIISILICILNMCFLSLALKK